MHFHPLPLPLRAARPSSFTFYVFLLFMKIYAMKSAEMQNLRVGLVNVMNLIESGEGQEWKGTVFH